MSYQNIGTPRFYVNILEWLISKDLIEFSANSMNNMVQLYRTLPVEPILLTAVDLAAAQFNIPQYILNEQSFVAALGLKNNVSQWPFTVLDGFDEYEIIINGEMSVVLPTGVYPPSDGFSIASFNGTDITTMQPFFMGNLVLL